MTSLIPNVVYLLCGLMSLTCATLLLRGYLRSRARLLLWSALCFGLFAINNALLVIDVVILPDVEFQGILWRNFFGATAGSLLLFGLIWEMT